VVYLLAVFGKIRENLTTERGFPKNGREAINENWIILPK